MAKTAHKYLTIHPYKIIEDGFHIDRYQVSESLFSLSNEYMGIRGFFDEDYTTSNTLIGSYFNGVYDYSKETLNTGYKGIVKRTHFMVNSVNYYKIQLKIDNEILDLSKVKFDNFYRELSFLSGLYIRKFDWILSNGKIINIEIQRFLSLINCHNAFQKIILTSDKECEVELSLFLDFDMLQWGVDCYFENFNKNVNALYVLANTLFTKQKVVSKMSIDGLNDYQVEEISKGIKATSRFKLNNKKEITRYVTNIISKEYGNDDQALINTSIKENKEIFNIGYEKMLDKNIAFFKDLYNKSDVNIIGNDEDLQGIRYCIFMLNCTNHGYSPYDNVGAKGLTGEAYSGHAFWDSETYCLPYYLFNNFEAAKNMLLYRYHTLKQAKNRAKMLDCNGACFPIATLDGNEGCTLWQHASLQVQPTSAVAYAIFHYYSLTNDMDFINKYGMELLIETARFLLDRGQYNSDGSKFSYYAVMGPDEFKMMVNHNAYTNYMGKFCFDYTLKMFNLIDDSLKAQLMKKCDVDETFFLNLKTASEKMYLPFDKTSKLIEQNEGFFDLPHIDINSIPREQFPLYSNWTYDRIYRGDMIKQPDVLMLFFLFPSMFDKDVKMANYLYYEPRCIHESSLSPSIHSILANELKRYDEAISFFGFASRLDLDDYNNNTREGLHMTSIAAAWINIVYGFGGLRSDNPIICLSPTIPDRWEEYSFKLTIKDCLLTVTIDKNKVKLNATKPITIKLYDKTIEIKDNYETNINQN